jgi:hypothetical protein
MQTFRYLMLGAFVGASLGWGIVAYFYFWSGRSEYDIGFEWVNQPLPKSFWPTSGYFAVIGALIGSAGVATKVIVYPYMRHLGILH